MDILSFLPEHWQAIALQVIAGLTLLMPFIEWVVKLTPTTEDDKIVAAIVKFLSFIPRVRLGGK